MENKISLNKEHGFMKSIVRNQIDRDNYEKEVQSAKLVPKSVPKQSAAIQQKPAREIYVAPHHRMRSTDRLFVFEFVHKDQQVIKEDIYEDTDVDRVAEKLGGSLRLSEPMMRAMGDFLRAEMDKLKDEQ